MFNVRSVFISILIGLSIVACTEQKNHPDANVASEPATGQKVFPADEKARTVQTSVIVDSQSNAQFDPLFANTVHELTGKKIVDGTTTFDASNNPSETKFSDGSKIMYVSGRLRQYVDTNGKVTSYNSDQKNHPITSVDSDGFIEQFIYDADGNLISKRDKDGRLVRMGKSN